MYSKNEQRSDIAWTYQTIFNSHFPVFLTMMQLEIFEGISILLDLL